MTDNLRPVVVKIIENFKSRLDASVRKQISNVQYSDLGMMIDEVIAEEIGSAADLVEEVVRKLCASTCKVELEL